MKTTEELLAFAAMYGWYLARATIGQPFDHTSFLKNYIDQLKREATDPKNLGESFINFQAAKYRRHFYNNLSSRLCNIQGWCFFFSSSRRHTSWNCDWSSDVCSSDLDPGAGRRHGAGARRLRRRGRARRGGPGVRRLERQPRHRSRRLGWRLGVPRRVASLRLSRCSPRDRKSVV